jgi:hypothetical protein
MEGDNEIGAALRDWSQPHWVWGAAFVFAPACLIVLGFTGSLIGSLIPLDLASIAPKAALAIAASGWLLALLLRRRVPIAITTFGVAISTGGFFLLRWLSA